MLRTDRTSGGRRSSRPARIPALIVVVAMAAMLMPFGAVAQETSANIVYFDGTGQTLGGAFYDGWLAQGGLAEAGAPVSAAVKEGNSWVQWFERARLEVNAPALEQAVAEDVHPAEIGMALAESFGLSRWHPAFQPVSGAAPEGVREFPTGHRLANAFLADWEANDGEARLGAPISEEFGLNGATYQFFERGALSWTSENGVEEVSLGYLDAAVNGSLQIGEAQPEGVPVYSGPGGTRWIDINLSNYTITAFEGNNAVFSSIIVDGAPATPTVTGTFHTYWKLVTQTMTGPNVDGTEFIQEDVPWVMYFYADFAIHGAYWRYSFGYSGSHGCVNLPVPDAEWLYNWAPVGTRVEVHY